jgi:prolyl 4-hydroxylase
MSTGVVILALLVLLPPAVWLGVITSRRRRYPIREFPGFLSDSECEHLIERARPVMKRSTTSVRGRAGNVETGRTSSTAFLDQAGDPVVQGIKRRIAEISDTPVENQERIQVTHYGEGQQFDAHYDSLRHGGMDRGESGDRLCTVILYLNDDFEGGATRFPRVHRRVRAERGKAVLFGNLTPDRRYTERLSWHCGETISRGEKWLSNQWIRENARNPSKPDRRTPRGRKRGQSRRRS